MQQNKYAEGKNSGVYLGLLFAVTASYCVWVFSLPLFPTQDGPMHLYFTHVLQSLLTDRGGFYSHYYYIRHLLPPYALYYYALMSLSLVMPVLLADKIIICLYFFSFAFGFRYLARSLGPNGDVLALLATIIMLNWPLGMGFVNFCISTSFALWALGLWCRAVTSPGSKSYHRRLVTFVLLCYIIMLTHPVPLLAVFGFCCIDLVVRAFRNRSAGREAEPSRFFWVQFGYVLIAMGTLGYVKLFTTSHVMQQVHISPQPRWQAELSLLKGYVLLHSLTAFAGKGFADSMYRLIFYGLLAGSLWVAVRQLLRARRSGMWTMAETWTLTSVLLLLSFPFIPSDVNNSAYFSARLVLFVWIASMIAAAGARFDWAGTRPTLALVTVFATILTLGMAHSRINPIARDIASIEQMPAVPSHEVGLLIHSPNYQLPATTTYDPYFWSGVRMFRRTDSVLYNTPWLDLAIIPIGPEPVMPTYKLSANTLEYPPGLRKEMDDSPEVRSLMLSHVGFALISFGRRQREEQFDPLLTPASGNSALGGLRSQPWNCNIEGTYSLCERD